MHLTESCLLKVAYDIAMASDAGDCSVWVLLHLSLAFNTVDHSISGSYTGLGFFICYCKSVYV